MRESIQKKRIWVSRAMREQRCIKCAAFGHRGDDCTAGGPSKKDEHEINALVSEMENRLSIDSEMENDLEYLCSIATSPSPLAMYKCVVNKQGERLLATSELPECMSLASTRRRQT